MQAKKQQSKSPLELAVKPSTAFLSVTTAPTWGCGHPKSLNCISAGKPRTLRAKAKPRSWRGKIPMVSMFHAMQPAAVGNQKTHKLAASPEILSSTAPKFIIPQFTSHQLTTPRSYFANSSDLLPACFLVELRPLLCSLGLVSPLCTPPLPEHPPCLRKDNQQPMIISPFFNAVLNWLCGAGIWSFLLKNSIDVKYWFRYQRTSLYFSEIQSMMV